MKAVQPHSMPDYHTTNSKLSIPSFHQVNQNQSEPCFYDSLQMVDNEVRQHFQQEKPKKKRKMNKKERLQVNGCISSPVGYDVFLSCSSGSELEWITKQAVPQLQWAFPYNIQINLKIFSANPTFPTHQPSCVTRRWGFRCSTLPHTSYTTFPRTRRSSVEWSKLPISLVIPIGRSRFVFQPKPNVYCWIRNRWGKTMRRRWERCNDATSAIKWPSATWKTWLGGGSARFLRSEFDWG